MLGVQHSDNDQIIEPQYCGSYHALVITLFNLVMASKRAGYEEILKYYSLCLKLQDILAFIDI